MAKQYATKELELSKKIQFEEGIAMGSYHLGVYYNNTSNVDSAFYYYNQSKNLFQEQNNIQKILTVNHGLAILEYSQGNYQEAISILKSNIGIHQEQEYDSANQDRFIAFHIIKKDWRSIKSIMTNTTRPRC